MVFKGKVYNKASHLDKTLTLCWKVSLPVCISLLLLLIFNTNEELGSSFISKIVFFFAFALMILIGVIRIIQTSQLNGTIGETTTLTISKDYISFFNNNISFKDIDELIIRIGTKKFENYVSGNNYLEVKTHSKKYELGLIIDGNEGIISLEQIIKPLIVTNRNIIYERYVTLNFG